MLPVNALHSSLRLVLGALGLAVAGQNVAARLYARGIALLYAVFAVCGCLPALDTLFGLIPLFGYNVALHAAVAAITAYIGWAPGLALAPEAASRPGGWWFARVVATVVGVCVLWFGVVFLSLFHEVTWWYNGPVRPSAAIMRNWIARELPPRATKAQTLAFLRSHFIGRGGGDDQYVDVYADEIDVEVDFVRYVPGCSLMLNLAFHFDRTGHLSTHSLDERPICL